MVFGMKDVVEVFEEIVGMVGVFRGTGWPKGLCSLAGRVEQDASLKGLKVDGPPPSGICALALSEPG